MAKKGGEKLNEKVFTSAADALKRRDLKTVLPVSPNLDIKLGGGILDGSFCLIQTFPKVGKTLLCSQIANNALKQGRKVVYADVECRLDEYKYGIDKLIEKYSNTFTLLKSHVTPKGEIVLINGSDVYESIYKLAMLPENRGAVYIIDSMSKAITKDAAVDSNIIADRRDGTAKLNSDFCKKFGNLLRVTDGILIGVQHLSVGQGQFAGVEADGGAKLQYEADIVLKALHKPLGWNGESLNVEKGKSELTGQLVKWKLPYNKMLGPYISKENPIMNYFKFGEGVWWAREALDVLIEIGLVTVGGGGWHTFTTEKIEEKIQGETKSAEAIEEHREYFEALIRQYFVDTFGINYNYENKNIKY